MNEELVEMNLVPDSNNVWAIQTDGKYVNTVKAHLTIEGIPNTGIDSIVYNAAKVMSFCPNPETQELYQKTGLVIGKVQSGKTSNFITLAALAFDNKYEVVVVLGGTKKNLVKQNCDRIEKYFESSGDVVILDSINHKDYLEEAKICQLKGMGKKIIIVLLKNKTQINSINELLFRNTSLSRKPILIIDDEGDEASLNTLVYKGKMSPTYRAIFDLKESLYRHCFLSVTATPQANILISTVDILSPDFGILVEPGEGYCGLETFHGSESKYTHEIKNNEISLVEDEGIPDSFVLALSTFFVGCGIREFIGMEKSEKHSMLVHPSQIKINHEKVYQKINALIKLWIDMAKNKEDVAYDAIVKILVDGYDELKKSFKDIPPFEVIENVVIKSISNCGTHIINGDKVQNNADNFFRFNIYIGGNMLSRGVTLSGLAITYIIRTTRGTSTIDTVHQRARWFGYKTKYIHLCRIFAVNKIIREFIEIKNHEIELWETVRIANLQGSRFRDIARVFTLSNDMNMTRTNVARTVKFTFNFWNFQRHFNDVDEYTISNRNVTNLFKNQYSDKIETLSFGEGTPHKALMNFDFNEFRTQVLCKLIFPKESKLNQGIINALYLALKKVDIQPRIDIVWMRDGEPAVHPVCDGVVSEYMVGRRPNDKSIPARYEGDRYFLVKNDTMQIQIHEIKDKNTQKISQVFALYIPVQYMSKMTKLVIGEEPNQ